MKQLVKSECREEISVTEISKLGPKPSQTDVEIDEAVERIYRKYGPDLSVFFAAVHHRLQSDQRNKPIRP